MEKIHSKKRFEVLREKKTSIKNRIEVKEVKNLKEYTKNFLEKNGEKKLDSRAY